MMLFGVNRIQYLEVKIERDELKKENEKLAYANKVYKERLDGEMANASFATDWDAMKAFSVERMWENGVPKTIIGYILSEPVVTTEGEGEQRVTYKDVVREWTYYCSAARHEELVKEFNTWKGKKK